MYNFLKLYSKNYKMYISGSVIMLLKDSTKIKTIKAITTLISLWRGNSSKVLIRNHLFGDLYNNILVFIDCLSTAISYLILVSAFVLFFWPYYCLQYKTQGLSTTQLKQIYPLHNQHIKAAFISWLLDSMVFLN